MVLIIGSPLAAVSQSRAQSLLERAQHLADLYNWAGAAADFSEAEQLFRADGDRRNALLARLGRIRGTIEQDQRGLPAVSIQLEEELETNSLLQTDKQLRLWALVVKGDIDGEINAGAMRSDWAEVQRLARDLGDRKWQYRALAQLGVAAFYDGDPETARTNVGAAVDAAIKAGDLGAQIRYVTVMGIGLAKATMSEQALPYFDNALQIAATVPESGYPFVTQEARMSALIGLQRIDEADTLAHEVLQEARKEGRRSHEVVVLGTLADVQIMRRNNLAALTTLNEGIAVAQAAGLLRVLSEMQTTKAGILTRRGELDAAENAVQAAAAASQQGGETWGVPQRLQILAELYTRRGKYAQADDTYDRAEAFIDAMLGKASTVLDKTALIRASSEVYTKHFALVADRLRNTEKAYSIVEQVRGRVAKDMLISGKRYSPEARQIERKIAKLRLQVMSAQSTAEIRKLRDKIFLAEQARWMHPGVSILKSSTGRDIPLEELQQSLAPSEAILTYVLAEPRSYCLVITKAGSRVIPLIGRAAIESRVSSYRKAVQSELPATQESRALYRILLQPVRKAVWLRRLVVVRDGQLHLIPFDALRTPSGEYLVQMQTIQYAPSATSYYLLARAQSVGKVRVKSESVLAVGGVPYSSTKLGAGDITRGYTRTLTNLPSSADEVRAVRNALGPSRTTTLTGSRATETAITQADLRRFEVIHLAVHGLANIVYPDRAALVLLSDPSAGEDGFLQSSEIVQLRLNSALVVLSACESAVGALQGQEGIANLSRAFLLAGARTVVSSLWAVDDKSSLYLMRRFYGRIAQGETLEIALAKAKRDLIRDFGPNAVPYHWAAFTLEGLGQTRIRATEIPGRSGER